MFSTVEEAIEDLKNGKLIIVTDDEDRENEGDLLGLADLADAAMINFMATHGKGLICLPIDGERAARLGLEPMVNRTNDKLHTAFTVSVDHNSSTTGISAFERARTARELMDERSAAGDFIRPGHMFPLVAKPGGVLERPGHTEAAVDLARLAGHSPGGIICEIMDEDGSMARLPSLTRMAREHGLKLISIKQLAEYRKVHDPLVIREAETALPTDFGPFTVSGYTERNTGREHVALVCGNLSGEGPVPVRIHSECLTGDVFGSCRCDCGPQLRAALRQIQEGGRGILLYMRQEGRGIGLINKLKAYKLQEDGLDTVEANERLGFPDDAREYATAAGILHDLGVKEILLMTNNPRKIAGLEESGIRVSGRIPLEAGRREENERYMQTKAEKLGHLLQI
ncbi:bifunctional 3,4-dihydroxy-2-butanone-4-phosphate synthase/GTP cyclohydrolase II [Edaphobacillus lindanitolerans]|uniref:Riboflavin biosynthesis protein RibBA n=1 Tax=Edaphobacillus lindanitolerans TaxID=550447 RepID=A0A1U7PIA9_9BACI|nr:bifunctional 3,4-dihydroxy-2-butanone-4-phosphate synthase/GTP cyclohydrolase II [Edaphobacillus lindanitolerans]SIT66136.1 GTP cyclohydrolase II /3,4-dihydroxy-2-butanone 4-phosphate synthase [Edaphobacillus lindanitolerans]